MKRALIKRLYKDDSSQETVMLMEATESKERFRITIPREKAAILALEGHGLNDRCSLYRLLSECIAHLGGALRSVAVNLDRSKGVNGAVSLARGAEVTWIKADVVELVAFALHLQIPIYLDVVEGPDDGEPRPTHQATELPPVFEDALTEIMSSESGAGPASAERGDTGGHEETETRREQPDGSG